MRKMTLVVAILTGLAWIAAPVFAQTAPPPRSGKQATAAPNNAVSPLFWSVNTMMEGYIQNMSKYYNLTPEQQDYTRKLMNVRVKSFLNDYEKDVRWLAAEIVDYHLKGELPPREIVKEWGVRAKQLLPAIRQEILAGNKEWRNVLNDQQKVQHDRDLKQMSADFDRFEKTFDSWAKGEMSDSDPIFSTTIGNKPRTVRKHEDTWDYYVKSFIQLYTLDESQRQTAFSVLRQLREEATRYREAHKEDFAKLDAADAEVARSDPKQSPEELKKSQERSHQNLDQRRRMEQPIAAMFERLKSQLNAIPTADQRRARERQIAKLESAAKKSATRPAVSAASQPSSGSADAAHTVKKP